MRKDLSILAQYFALVAGVIAGIFYFLAFVYPEIAKGGSKNKLKKINCILQEQTMFQIGKDYFGRIVKRLARFTPRARQFWYFSILMFLLNIIIIPLSCLIVEYIKHKTLKEAWVVLLSYKMYKADIWRGFLLHISGGLIGCGLNVISLYLTLQLLKKMSTARNRLMLLFHLFLNCLVVSWFAFFLLPTSVIFNWKLADENNSWTTFAQAWHGTYHDKPDVLIPILYGATSGIPTVIYLLTALSILVFKLIPESLRKFIIDIIKALTRDDRNVFADMGRFFTVLGGLAAGAKFLFG